MPAHPARPERAGRNIAIPTWLGAGVVTAILWLVLIGTIRAIAALDGPAYADLMTGAALGTIFVGAVVYVCDHLREWQRRKQLEAVTRATNGLLVSMGVETSYSKKHRPEGA